MEPRGATTPRKVHSTVPRSKDRLHGRGRKLLQTQDHPCCQLSYTHKQHFKPTLALHPDDARPRSGSWDNTLLSARSHACSVPCAPEQRHKHREVSSFLVITNAKAPDRQPARRDATAQHASVFRPGSASPASTGLHHYQTHHQDENCEIEQRKEKLTGL